MKELVVPTPLDCARGVHYFQCGLMGTDPGCGHHREYKRCKNCGKVVWTQCERCGYLTIHSEQNRAGGKARAVVKAIERGRKLIAEAKNHTPQNEWG